MPESQKRMVFHAPFPVKEGATSASGIRPWKMLQAFKDAGYQVFEITGYAAERRARFASLKRGMAGGWQPDFVYSEAATIPSSFTERKHFPLILNLERRIFRYFHDKGVPSGVFYRDVYWAFEDYERSVGKPVAMAMRGLYVREIETFNRYVDVVFLPTEQMGAFIPGLSGPRQVALPPGSEVAQVAHRRNDGSLSLLYVGAVGGHHYDIGALLDAVKEVPKVDLTICTRPDQWEAAVRDDPRLLGERIHVVHESGAGLEPLYEAADIACLVMKPQEYRSFAAPMKLYEYLGHGKPVLVSENTHAADVVEATGAGWVVPFDGSAIAGQLRALAENSEALEAKTELAAQAGAENTWEERAKFVAKTLLKPVLREGSHVLMVPSWYPKGSGDLNGSFFREQAEAMVRAGWKMGVMALEPDPLYVAGHRPQGALELTEENGVGVVRGNITAYLPLQRRINSWLGRKRLFAAFDAYVNRFGKPDVLHAHSLYPGAFFAAEISQRYGIPFVYTEHRTLSHLPARTKLAKATERKVAELARNRLAVSRGHAAHLTKRFGGLAWDYAPNLLPVGFAASSDKAKARDPKTYTFGHLSNLDPVKRVDRLIDAFAEVHASDKSVRLVIGGSGEEEEALRAQVQRLGLTEVVTLLGNVPRDEAVTFYENLDAFVLPSDSETMGVVQIEALSAGVPVISTRTWGGQTVIEEGDGLLVDIGDQSQLVEAMRKMRAETETSQQREDRHARSVGRFGEDAFVARYAEIYRHALD